MRYRLASLLAIIAVFGVLSARALMDVGYIGIIIPHFRSWGGAQVFADLVILAILACRWIRSDARRRGMTAWPYIAVTVFAGSFGPLFYLLARELSATARSNAGINSAVVVS